MVPGAAVSAVAWQLLLTAAGAIVAHLLRHAQAVAGLFGVVLGLLAWFGLAPVVVSAIEADQLSDPQHVDSGPQPNSPCRVRSR